MTDQEIDLDVLNKNLVRSREQLGLDAHGRGAVGIAPMVVSGRPRVEDRAAPIVCRPRPGERSNGTTVPSSFAEALGSMPQKGSYRCAGTRPNGERCQTTIDFPGRCPSCYAAVDAADLAVKVRERLRRIPLEYRDASWDTLADLASRGGGDRVKLDRRRLRTIRERLAKLPAGARVVLHGPPGCGKSTIAGAWLRSVIESGSESAFWVPADDLDLEALPEGESHNVLPREALRSGEDVVFDDLGGETANAPRGSGLLSMRIAHAVKAITARHAKNRGRILITSNYNEAEIEERYTRRISRRIFEGAITIDMEKP